MLLTTRFFFLWDFAESLLEVSQEFPKALGISSSPWRAGHDLLEPQEVTSCRCELLDSSGLRRCCGSTSEVRWDVFFTRQNELYWVTAVLKFAPTLPVQGRVPTKQPSKPTSNQTNNQQTNKPTNQPTNQIKGPELQQILFLCEGSRLRPPGSFAG